MFNTESYGKLTTGTPRPLCTVFSKDQEMNTTTLVDHPCVYKARRKNSPCSQRGTMRTVRYGRSKSQYQDISLVRLRRWSISYHAALLKYSIRLEAMSRCCTARSAGGDPPTTISVLPLRSSSRVSDDRFTMMSQAYENEQRDLKADVEVLRQEIETQEQQNQNLEQFIQKVRKYAELTELTPYAAHELIKAIYVGAPDKSSGKRRQSIHICYDLIGFIPLSELMTQEMA